MKGRTLIRAWKDPEYRAAHTDVQSTRFNHPSGLQEIEDAVLNSVTGGCNPGCGGGSGPTTLLWSCNNSGQGQPCY